MQPVANTKTDADGHFMFDNPLLGTAPMLLRAIYRGVNYHEPVPPGKYHRRRAGLRAHRQAQRRQRHRACHHSAARRLRPRSSAKSTASPTRRSLPLAFYKADGSFVSFAPSRRGAEPGLRRKPGRHARDSDAPSTRARTGKRSPSRFAPATAACACPTMFPTPIIKRSSPSFLPTPRIASESSSLPPCRSPATASLPPARSRDSTSTCASPWPRIRPFAISVSGTAPPPPQEGAGPAVTRRKTHP